MTFGDGDWALLQFRVSFLVHFHLAFIITSLRRRRRRRMVTLSTTSTMSGNEELTFATLARVGTLDAFA